MELCDEASNPIHSTLSVVALPTINIQRSVSSWSPKTTEPLVADRELITVYLLDVYKGLQTEDDSLLCPQALAACFPQLPSYPSYQTFNYRFNLQRLSIEYRLAQSAFDWEVFSPPMRAYFSKDAAPPKGHGRVWSVALMNLVLYFSKSGRLLFKQRLVRQTVTTSPAQFALLRALSRLCFVGTKCSLMWR